MRIFIFTLATSVYNAFIQKQKETLNFLFPNLEKYYIVISDEQPNFIDNDHYLFYKIIDHPYPLVTLSKYIYINAAIPNFANDNDLFLFFDADTYFKEKPNNIWEDILNNLNNYDLIFSYSPWYLLPKKYNITDNFCWWKFFKGNYINYVDFMNDDEEYSSHYDMDDNSVYVQTSFLGGKLGKLKQLNEDVKILMSMDLCHTNTSQQERQHELIRHLPLASEENYTNKIINDHIHNKLNKYNFYIDTFHSCDYLCCRYNYNDFPYIICGQKYDNDKKTLKRNCS